MGKPWGIQGLSYAVVPWDSRVLKRSVALSVVSSVNITESTELISSASASTSTV